MKVVEVRYFDPLTDDPGVIAYFFPYSKEEQDALADLYRQSPPPSWNLIVAVDGNKIVGCVHILDGGHPWATMDAFYLAPEYRSFVNARRLGMFAEDELRRRGVKAYSIYVPEPLATALRRHGLHQDTKTDFALLGRSL